MWAWWLSYPEVRRVRRSSWTMTASRPRRGRGVAVRRPGRGTTARWPSWSRRLCAGPMRRSASPCSRSTGGTRGWACRAGPASTAVAARSDRRPPRGHAQYSTGQGVVVEGQQLCGGQPATTARTPGAAGSRRCRSRRPRAPFSWGAGRSAGERTPLSGGWFGPVDAAWPVAECVGDTGQVGEVPDDGEPHLRALQAGRWVCRAPRWWGAGRGSRILRRPSSAGARRRAAAVPG